MSAVLVISACDNVGTALEDLDPGASIALDGGRVVVAERIPRGHKVALRAVAAGDPIVKYSSPIGTATTDIAAGAHVHVHNVASARGRGDLTAHAPLATAMAAPRIAEPEDLLADGKGEDRR